MKNPKTTMLALTAIGIFLALCGAVTYYALASAPPGYEDKEGFHQLAEEESEPELQSKLQHPPASKLV